MIIPTEIKGVIEDIQSTDLATFQDITIHPIVRGVIEDWDVMENLLNYVFYIGLGWKVGNEGQVLYADPLLTPKGIREQLVQLMIEMFNMRGLCASEQVVDQRDTQPVIAQKSEALKR
eukprot:Gb_09583 [translate_table: standard]